VAKCDVCGKEEYLPYKCKYCGGTFCVEHRLPEKHNCPGIRKDEDWNVPVKVKRERPVEVTVPVRRTVRKVGAYGWNNLIIAICTVILFLKLLFGSVIDYYLALTPALLPKMPWQIVTAIFDHAGFWHYFVNMFVLFFFGAELERRVGNDYLKVFFTSGIAGNLAYIAYALLEAYALKSPVALEIPALGASAAIFGVMGALAMIAPYINVVIFPIPIPINIRWAILLFALYDIIFLPFTMQTGVAHISHLAGLLVGLYMGKMLRMKRRSEWYLGL